MDEKLLEYKVGEHDDKLKKHDTILNEHEHMLNDLVNSNQRLADSIDKLTDNVRAGFGMFRWLIGLGITSLVGFFFFVIQSML